MVTSAVRAPYPQPSGQWTGRQLETGSQVEIGRNVAPERVELVTGRKVAHVELVTGRKVAPVELVTAPIERKWKQTLSI